MHYDESSSFGATKQDSNPSEVSITELREQLDPLLPIYLLVDPLLGDLLPDLDSTLSSAAAHAARERIWGRRVTNVVLNASVQLPSHLHPYLVHLIDRHDPLLELTLITALGELSKSQKGGISNSGAAAHRIGGWLQTSMPSPDLGRSISILCEINTDAYTAATYLRMADRRVIGLLSYLVGSERLSVQLGRLTTWIFLDAVGKFRRIDSPQGDAVRLRLTTAEWKRLEAGEFIHRTQAIWLGALRDLDNQPAMTLFEMYAAIEELISKRWFAKNKWPHRILNTQDELIWATLALLYPECIQSRNVDDLLSGTGTEEEPPEAIRYMLDELIEILLREQKVAAITLPGVPHSV